MVSSGIDSNEDVHPILVDSSGRQYVCFEFDETQILEDMEIRDDEEHVSDVIDCRYFNIITIWIKNDLDQSVGVQVKGSRIDSTTEAVDVGDEFIVASGDSEARTIVPVNEGFLPFIFIELGAEVVPTSGNLNAYLIRKPI